MNDAFESPKSVPGKVLLPQLGVGCLIFTLVMGYGTFWLARVTTPFFVNKNKEYLRTHHISATQPVAPAPSTTR